MTTPLTPEELSSIALLRGVDPERSEELLVHCLARKLSTNECLIRPGKTNRMMYLLLSGKLRIHLENLENDPIAILGPGESVGELSMLDDKPTSAFVVAQEDCRLLAVTEQAFWTMVNSSHEFAVNLLTVFAERLRGNNGAIAETRRLKRKYQRHATTDQLTGLYNRRWIDEFLPRQMKRSQMNAKPLSLIMIDVDFFKKFNDTYGHQAGDFVLRTVADTLRKRFRPTDLPARFGGEEFMVILPDIDSQEAETAANRVREDVGQVKMETPDEVKLPSVTVSMGIAELKESDTPESIIERADKALYRAKENGRNRCEK